MLVDTAWLAEHLDAPDLVVVDMRWREDGSGRARYEAGHVPGAAFLDWSTDIVDPDHRFAFMLAPPERFAGAVERCGIGDGTTVVAYADVQSSGPFRLWWAFRAYGHDGLRILDGGLDKWCAEGRPLSTDDAVEREARWTPRQETDQRQQADAVDVMAAASDAGTIVLDSRPPGQFRGESVWFETGPVAAGPDGIARTPRGELRAGRVPWAANVPSAELYRPDATMKSPNELQELFAEAGARPEHRVITYCGVGISASALLYALSSAGFRDVALYDASWEEWGRDPGLPVSRG